MLLNLRVFSHFHSAHLEKLFSKAGVFPFKVCFVWAYVNTAFALRRGTKQEGRNHPERVVSAPFQSNHGAVHLWCETTGFDGNRNVILTRIQKLDN